MGHTMPFIKVIQRDYAEIEENPIENVIVEKKDGDISEWNLMFHIENVKGDSFNDQLYFGQISFPQAYPYEPPTIKICKTPNIKVPKEPLYLPIIEDWCICTTAKQIIQHIQDVIKFFYKTRELNKDPEFPFLLDNLFYDIFKFLDREHVEKCQMVCNVWRSLLQKKSDVLPRRKLEALVISNNTSLLSVKIFKHSLPDRIYEYEDPGNKGEKICSITSTFRKTFDFNKIRTLKNSVFEKVLLIAYGAIWPGRIFDLLKKIVDNSGQKIRTVKYIDKISKFDFYYMLPQPYQLLWNFGLPPQLPQGNLNLLPQTQQGLYNFGIFPQLLAANNLPPPPQQGNFNFDQPLQPPSINNADLIPYTTQLYPYIFEYLHAENFYKHIMPNELDSIVTTLESLNIPAPPFMIELSILEKPPTRFMFPHLYLAMSWRSGLTTVDRMFDCLVQLQNRDVRRFSLVTLYETFDQHIYDLTAKVLSNFILVNDPALLPFKVQINFNERVFRQDEFILNLRRENRPSNVTYKDQSGPNFQRIIFQRRDHWKLSIELQTFMEESHGHLKLEVINP